MLYFLLSYFVLNYQSNAPLGKAFLVCCSYISFHRLRCGTACYGLNNSGTCPGVCQLRRYCVTQAMKCNAFPNRFQNSNIHSQSTMSPDDDFRGLLHVQVHQATCSALPNYFVGLESSLSLQVLACWRFNSLLILNFPASDQKKQQFFLFRYRKV